jgi:FMN-dependent NADH-azoreductase
MVALLHIQASVRGERSYSLRAAKAFIESYRESHPGDSVRTVDLSVDPIPEFDGLAVSGKYRILHGEDHTEEEARAWKAVEAAIEEFKKADKLVISAPMWNFGVPYRMKRYIDVIMQPGSTFSYSPEAGYAGLVTGRPAVLFLARGGEYPVGTDSAAMDFQRPYLETILRFIGFTEIETIVIEPTLMGGPDVAAQKLEEAIKRAREKAASF